MANFFKNYTNKYMEKHKDEKVEIINVVGNKDAVHPKPSELTTSKNQTRREKEITNNIEGDM